MSILDLFRKGFGYALMSMGVSSPAAGPKPPKPAPQPADRPAAGPEAAGPDAGQASRK